MYDESIIREPVEKRVDFTLNFFQRIFNPIEEFAYFIAAVVVFSAFPFLLISIFFVKLHVWFWLFIFSFMIFICVVLFRILLVGVKKLFSQESSRCLVITKNFIGYGKKDVEFRLLKHAVKVQKGLAGTYVIRHLQGCNLVVTKNAIQLSELKELVGDTERVK